MCYEFFSLLLVNIFKQLYCVCIFNFWTYYIHTNSNFNVTTLFLSYSPFIISISQLEIINLKCAHNIFQLHTVKAHIQTYKNTCLFVLHVSVTM